MTARLPPMVGYLRGDELQGMFHRKDRQSRKKRRVQRLKRQLQATTEQIQRAQEARDQLARELQLEEDPPLPPKLVFLRQAPTLQKLVVVQDEVSEMAEWLKISESRSRDLELATRATAKRANLTRCTVSQWAQILPMHHGLLHSVEQALARAPPIHKSQQLPAVPQQRPFESISVVDRLREELAESQGNLVASRILVRRNIDNALSSTPHRFEWTSRRSSALAATKVALVTRRIEYKVVLNAMAWWSFRTQLMVNAADVRRWVKLAAGRRLGRSFATIRRRSHLVFVVTFWHKIAVDARNEALYAAARECQRIERGYLGRCRVRHRRRYDAALQLQRVERRRAAMHDLHRRRADFFTSRLIQDVADQYFSALRAAETERRKSAAEQKARETAATKVQTHARAAFARRKTLALQRDIAEKESRRQRAIVEDQAAVRIQKTVRGKLARLSIARNNDAAIRLQAAIRGSQQRRKFARRPDDRDAAAVVLQKTWRGRSRRAVRKMTAVPISDAYLATLSLDLSSTDAVATEEDKSSAASSLQRGWRAQRKRWTKRVESAATRLQSGVRGRLARGRRASVERAAIRVQSSVRGLMARTTSRRTSIEQAAIRVQSGVRGLLARGRRGSIEQAAIRVQTSVRGLLTTRSSSRRTSIEQAAIRVQSSVRAIVRAQSGRLSGDWFATSLQRVARGRTARRCVDEMRQSRGLVDEFVAGVFKSLREDPTLWGTADVGVETAAVEQRDVETQVVVAAMEERGIETDRHTTTDRSVQSEASPMTEEVGTDPVLAETTPQQEPMPVPDATERSYHEAEAAFFEWQRSRYGGYARRINSAIRSVGLRNRWRRAAIVLQNGQRRVAAVKETTYRRGVVTIQRTARGRQGHHAIIEHRAARNETLAVERDRNVAATSIASLIRVCLVRARLVARFEAEQEQKRQVHIQRREAASLKIECWTRTLFALSAARKKRQERRDRELEAEKERELEAHLDDMKHALEVELCAILVQNGYRKKMARRRLRARIAELADAERAKIDQRLFDAASVIQSRVRGILKRDYVMKNRKKLEDAKIIRGALKKMIAKSEAETSRIAQRLQHLNMFGPSDYLWSAVRTEVSDSDVMKKPKYTSQFAKEEEDDGPILEEEQAVVEQVVEETAVVEVPQDWIQAYDDNAGAHYWYNTLTGEASWVPPGQQRSDSFYIASGEQTPFLEDAVANTQALEVYDPNAAWIEAYDETHGAPYWFNTVTYESSWEPPSSDFNDPSAAAPQDVSAYS